MGVCTLPLCNNYLNPGRPPKPYLCPDNQQTSQGARDPETVGMKALQSPERAKQNMRRGVGLWLALGLCVPVGQLLIGY